jgi:hypothetical protein
LLGLYGYDCSSPLIALRLACQLTARWRCPRIYKRTFGTFLQSGYHRQCNCTFVQAIHPQINTGDKRRAIYSLFAAYIHTIPLEELIESVERARLDAKLRYVVIYGAACSYCLGKAQRLDGSYLRTFALEFKERLAQTLATFVTSILTQPRKPLGAESAAEPPLRQIIEVLQQVMCTHDAEKLAISVLEINKDRKCEECGNSNADTAKENSLASDVSASQRV